MKPLVTVIIPVYNVEKYIKKCIDSVITQTYKTLEIILIDDGSLDDCGKICDSYTKIDSRIKVIHKINEGQAVARNVGLDIAKGDYIFFVDSDDYILPNAIYEMLKAIIKNKADLVICGVINDHVFAKKECPKLNKAKVYNKEELIISFLTEPYIRGTLCNKLYKSSLFTTRRFSPIRAREDVELLYKLYGDCNKAVYIPKSLYVQLIRPGSTEQSPFNDAKLYTIIIFEEMANYINNMFPSLSNYTELLKAKAIGDAINAIAVDKRYHELKPIYNKLLIELKEELVTHQRYDEVNREQYNKLSEIVNNQKKFWIIVKVKTIKKFLLNKTKQILLNLYS